jgi:ketosteroid isomerase-like protein
LRQCAVEVGPDVRQILLEVPESERHGAILSIPGWGRTLHNAPVSRKNVEIVRRQAEAVNRRDVDAVLSDMDPEIEFIPRRAAVQGTYHGHKGVRDFFADTFETFDLFEATNEEVHDLGDRIVSIGKLRIRGKGSGVEVTVPTAIVLALRNGKIARFEDFSERSKALEAVGLPEQSTPAES